MRRRRLVQGGSEAAAQARDVSAHTLSRRAKVCEQQASDYSPEARTVLMQAREKMIGRSGHYRLLVRAACGTVKLTSRVVGISVEARV